MVEFVSERIQVERSEGSPTPVSFVWRGETYFVTALLREWVDVGYGRLPPRSRTWYNRHHRRYYVVLTSSGDTFKLCFDYADKRDRSWWLISKGEPA